MDKKDKLACVICGNRGICKDHNSSYPNGRAKGDVCSMSRMDAERVLEFFKAESEETDTVKLQERIAELEKQVVDLKESNRILRLPKPNEVKDSRLTIRVH